MRAVVQRVSSSSVDIEEKTAAEIRKGLLVLAGFHESDSGADIEYIINKILGLRIFEDAEGRMNQSVTDVRGEVLLISQFTLYGDARKGNRPSFGEAMQFEKAEIFYKDFIEGFRIKYPLVSQEVFGADMKVSLINDGPVTILLDSNRTF